MPRLRVIDDEVIERPFDKRQFLRLLTFLKPYRKPIAFSLCLMVTNAVCSLALPMLMSRAIDEINVGNSSSFPQFLIAMVVCAAVGSICVRYRARIMDTAGRNADKQPIHHKRPAPWHGGHHDPRFDRGRYGHHCGVHRIGDQRLRQQQGKDSRHGHGDLHALSALCIRKSKPEFIH